jgi:hypothetical protein
VFDKEVNDNIEQRPIVQVGSLLKMVGLGHEAIKKNKGGGMSVYQLNPVSYGEIMEIIQLRVSQKSTETAGEPIGD